MEGDTFEMEDQRNWTDASYKTYVRPLALPWPYTLAKGTVIEQAVRLSVHGTPAGPGPARQRGGGAHRRGDRRRAGARRRPRARGIDGVTANRGVLAKLQARSI